MSLPVDAPVWRPLLCPRCQHLCGFTDKQHGTHVIHCKQCREWRKIDDSQQATRQVDIAPRIRLVLEGE